MHILLKTKKKLLPALEVLAGASCFSLFPVLMLGEHPETGWESFTDQEMKLKSQSEIFLGFILHLFSKQNADPSQKCGLWV